LSKEIRSTLLVALERLPERQRLVVALRDIDGLTSDEVCDVLGVSAANQRVLLHRGRVRLRAALETFVRDGPDE
jgi:RNA polymerase sigma-70 factor (ECF subfamily)